MTKKTFPACQRLLEAFEFCFVYQEPPIILLKHSLIMFRACKTLKGNAPFPPLWAITVMTFFGREETRQGRHVAEGLFYSAKRLTPGTGGTEEEGPELLGTCFADYNICSGARAASGEFSKE